MQEEAFIFTVRRALGVKAASSRCEAALFAPRVPGESEGILKRIRGRTAADRQALLERLKRRAVPINLNVVAVGDLAAAAAAVSGLVEACLPEWGGEKRVAVWRHPLLDRLDLPGVLKATGVPVVQAPLESAGRDVGPDRRRGFRKDVETAFIGVTTADWCVADSATLVIKTRPGQPRSVSLVPSIHVALIREDQVVADLQELYALLGSDLAHGEEGLTNCMTFISGPSKTADIEAQMVHGAHGPRELHLVIVPA